MQTKKITTELRKPTLYKVLFFIRSIIKSNDLNKLGMLYGTDKVCGHRYTDHYMLHFKKYRFKKIKLLEIGVGGYNIPTRGGHSLRMWKRYFPFGKIFSIDIFDKSRLQERRITIFRGSQTDPVFLGDVINQISNPDIIIDDGSHINNHVIKTFEILFPVLKDGGIYVIEDTQTSYWQEFGGDSNDLNNPKTMMNFFKKMADSLNNEEYIDPHYVQNYYDKKVISIHFYHNIIFIYKGNNDEKSNFVLNNNFRVNYRGFSNLLPQRANLLKKHK